VKLHKISVAAAAAVLTTLSAAACASGSNSGSSQATADSNSATSAIVAKAKAEVAKGEAGTTTWTGPSSSPPAAKNKTIIAVQSTPVASMGVINSGVVQAAKAIGWNVKTIAADGTPAGMASAVSNAINQKPDGIILEVVPLSLIGAQLQQATAAKIPVVEVQSGSPVPSGGFPVTGGIFADVSADLPALGQDDAWAAIANTNGKAVVGAVNDSTYPSITQRLEGFESVLSQCPACKVVKTLEVSAAQVATQAAPAVTAFLQANPDVNIMYSTYDAQAVYMVQAIATLGDQSKVSLVAADGDEVNTNYIRKGDVQVADVGYDEQLLGWGAVDQMNRAFAHVPPAPEWQIGGGGVGERLITKNSLPASGQEFQNAFDFRKKLLALWGLS
jgi:ribose transport system substrate-binding protein